MRMPFEKKSFLVVDDFGDMRSMLRSMLGMFGVTRIDAVSNGRDAILHMERGAYDVVLCDYNLGPGKDGQQVLEEARHRKLISYTTVFVMITAENTREMVMGAIEYEPDSYLSKPFTKDLLRSRLEKLLQKKQNLEPVDEAVQRKNFTRAIALLDRSIAKRPKNLAELTRLKAELCLQAGEYDQALGIYQRVLAIREIPWARLGVGKVHYLRKQYREAREIFQDLLYSNQDLTVAYDWLARTYQAMDDLAGAQEVLTSAVALSPKSVLRQKALGEVAVKNRDFASAEKAFERAVSHGRYSVYKHPSLYSRWAEAQIDNDARKDKSVVLGVLKQMEREFSATDSEAQLYMAVAGASIHQGLGDEKAAAQALQRADEVYERLGVHGKSDLTLTMARTAVRLGEQERAKALFHKVVRNNHDDDEFLRDVASVMGESGFEEDPQALIESIRHEIVELNNKGVKLAASGQVEQAMGLFEKAAEGMAGNKVINLNAAKVLMMHMERAGVDPDSMGRVRKYLERTRKLAPDDAGLAKAVVKFQKLAARV